MSTPTPEWQPPASAPQPPKKSWPRRHPVWTTVLGVTVVLVVLIIIGAALGSSSSSSPSANAAAVSTTTPTASATSAAPTPGPVPSPSGNITGSCDVSLSDSLYGQNY